MKCPMMFNGSLCKDDCCKDKFDCIAEQCAWYNKEHENCVIECISWQLQIMNGKEGQNDI